MQLDSALMVHAWRVTSGELPDNQPQRDPDAPYWWTSDEDASASFLRAQGLVLE
jgi:hypothetical protein